MITSQNLNLIKRIKHISNQSKSSLINNTHDEIGYNYKMTAIQAAIGIAQLGKLNSFLKIKTRIAKNYECLCKCKISYRHNWYVR